MNNERSILFGGIMHYLLKELKQKWRIYLPHFVIVSQIIFLFTLNSPAADASAALTNRSDTLETSAFTTAAKQTIKFTTATDLTMAAGTTGDFSVKVRYPTNGGGDPFTIPSLATSDVSVACSSGGT